MVEVKYGNTEVALGGNKTQALVVGTTIVLMRDQNEDQDTRIKCFGLCLRNSFCIYFDSHLLSQDYIVTSTIAYILLYYCFWLFNFKSLPRNQKKERVC